MIYVDTSVMVPLVEGSLAEKRAIRAFLFSISASRVIAVSPLTLTECLVKPMRSSDGKAEQLYRSYFRPSPTTVHVSIDDLCWELCAGIRAHYSFKLPDSLHLGTAQRIAALTSLPVIPPGFVIRT